jgi:sulfite reductase (NADPH) flavoprotein alpha-component
MSTFSRRYEYPMFEMRTPVDGHDRLLILFATVTGNAERVAHRLARKMQGCGFAACVMDMAHCTPEILAQERTVLIVASTCGDGEPPDDAASFCEALVRGHGWDLRRLKFSVLALGNLTFDHFCQCGRELDAAFERHGATRFYPRVDCDADYDLPARHWINGVTETLQRQGIVHDHERDRISARYAEIRAPQLESISKYLGAQAVTPDMTPVD